MPYERWKCALEAGDSQESSKTLGRRWALLAFACEAIAFTLGFLVVKAEGPYPIPSRTRKSSPPAPMVLQGPPCGRVGRRQIYAPSTKVLGASLLVSCPGEARPKSFAAQWFAALDELRWTGSADLIQPVSPPAPPRQTTSSLGTSSDLSSAANSIV